VRGRTRGGEREGWDHGPRGPGDGGGRSLVGQTERLELLVRQRLFPTSIVPDRPGANHELAVAGDGEREGPGRRRRPGGGEVHVDRVRGRRPRREVVLEPEPRGAALDDLQLDALDTARGRRRAVDGELLACHFHPPFQGVDDGRLVRLGSGKRVEVVERDAPHLIPALEVPVTPGEQTSWGHEHRLVAELRVRAWIPLE